MAKVKSFRFFIFLAVVIIYFMRPFALGLDNSVYSTLALLFVSLLLSLSIPPTISKGRYIISNLLFFYILHIFGRAALTGMFSATSFASLAQAMIIFLLFRNEVVMQYFFKYLKNVFLILCICGIANFVLETIFPLDKLLILEDLTYNDNTYSFDLYLPLNWTGMNWTIPGNTIISGTHIRQYYFFIEPGMVPTFFVAMMFIILSSPKEKNKILKIALLSIGILLTFSLGGVVIFFSAIVVYMLLGVLLKGKIRGSKKFLYILIAILSVFLTWYAYNYMPVFGKVARMEISQQSVNSIETHENIGNYIMLGVALLWLLGWRLSKYKKNRRSYLTIVFILGVGYLSNYIGFTTLATIFLFWDGVPDNGSNSQTKIKLDNVQLN